MFELGLCVCRHPASSALPPPRLFLRPHDPHAFASLPLSCTRYAFIQCSQLPRESILPIVRASFSVPRERCLRLFADDATLQGDAPLRLQ